MKFDILLLTSKLSRLHEGVDQTKAIQLIQKFWNFKETKNANANNFVFYLVTMKIPLYADDVIILPQLVYSNLCLRFHPI